MHSLFELPDELLPSSLFDSFPCREHQIRSLATLIHPSAAPSRNLVLYGTEATGKSAVIEALLRCLSHPISSSVDGNHTEAEAEDDSTSPPVHRSALAYAIVNSIQCITARHLFERTVGAVADALQWDNRPARCETAAQLAVELSKMLKYVPRPDGWRFVLVFDAIDRQRDASPTLLPALARLSEMIPRLTCVFIVTHPAAGFFRASSTPHVHFPNYLKADFVKILSTTPPETIPTTTRDDTLFLWPRFCTHVHDALVAPASRTLPAFRRACDSLWPRFIAPILAGTHGAREVPKLLIAARVHFQDEALLNPSIVSVVVKPSGKDTKTNSVASGTETTPTPGTTPRSRKNSTVVGPSRPHQPGTPDLASLLPTTARLLLLAAYLASHNTTKHDLTLFSTFHHGRRRRRGGGYAGGRQGAGARTKHRKIARKLLGAHAFVLERMMAIFAAVRSEWVEAALREDANTGGIGAHGLDADVGAALATLASLRLLVRVGGGAADPLDRGGKWRINVGWEAIRGVGRSMGVEVEEWLID